MFDSFDEGSVMKVKIKVLIVDDHEMYRDGVANCLALRKDIEVVGRATNGVEAVEAAKWLQPNIILMDFAMPEMNGEIAAKKIRETNPEIKVLILTTFQNEDFLNTLLDSVDGVLLKTDSASNLPKAIDAILRGNAWFPSELLKSASQASNAITSREHEILQLVCEGHSSKEIGTKLGIETVTVDTHRARIMKKLDLSNVASLIIYAVRNGLFIVPVLPNKGERN